MVQEALEEERIKLVGCRIPLFSQDITIWVRDNFYDFFSQNFLASKYLQNIQFPLQHKQTNYFKLEGAILY